MKRHNRFWALGCFILSGLLLTPASAQVQYQHTDLDVLLGIDSPYEKKMSVASAINDIGHVTGYYEVHIADRPIPQKRIGFIYRPESGVEEFEAPNDWSVKTLDLNDNDEVIGLWEDPQGNIGSFVYRGGQFENLDTFKKVYRINNEGDIVGVMAKARGAALDSTVAILKRDHTVVDILDGVTDCDESVAGDCGLNRIDFDYWKQIGDFNSFDRWSDDKAQAVDLNQNDEIIFSLQNNSVLSGCFKYGVYSYTPSVGVRYLMDKQFCMTPAGSGGMTSLSINTNGSVLISWTLGGWAPFGEAQLYTTDGKNMTPGTVLDSANLPPEGLFDYNSIFYNYPQFHTINDSNIIAGKHRTVFSITDYYQVYMNSDFLHAGDLPSITDINNSNTIVGYRDGLKKKAFVSSQETLHKDLGQ
ncbi:MAG: hypothetical protein DSZ28_04050 [Thiothrix sp.]|nr:MAG: hypothetical protein DSZ28_04050 [Thiothrix sp.]